VSVGGSKGKGCELEMGHPVASPVVRLQIVNPDSPALKTVQPLTPNANSPQTLTIT